MVELTIAMPLAKVPSEPGVIPLIERILAPVEELKQRAKKSESPYVPLNPDVQITPNTIWEIRS